MSRSGEARKPRAEVRVKALADENATLRAEVKHLRAELDAATTLHREAKARKDDEIGRLIAAWRALDCDCQVPGSVKCREAIREGFQRPLREENARLQGELAQLRGTIVTVGTGSGPTCKCGRFILAPQKGLASFIIVNTYGEPTGEAHAPHGCTPASDNVPGRKPTAVEGNGQWSTGSPR